MTSTPKPMHGHVFDTPKVGQLPRCLKCGAVVAPENAWVCPMVSDASSDIDRIKPVIVAALSKKPTPTPTPTLHEAYSRALDAMISHGFNLNGSKWERPGFEGSHMARIKALEAENTRLREQLTLQAIENTERTSQLLEERFQKLKAQVLELEAENAWMRARINELEAKLARATRALLRDGFTLSPGAEEWRPPLGKRHTVRKQEAIEAIEAGSPFKSSGVVLTAPDGQKCIVDMGAVRWLTKEEGWELMHPNVPTPWNEPTTPCQGHAAEQEREEVATSSTYWHIEQEAWVAIPIGLLSAACYLLRKIPKADNLVAEIHRYTVGDRSVAIPNPFMPLKDNEISLLFSRTEPSRNPDCKQDKTP